MFWVPRFGHRSRKDLYHARYPTCRPEALFGRECSTDARRPFGDGDRVGIRISIGNSGQRMALGADEYGPHYVDPSCFVCLFGIHQTPIHEPKVCLLMEVLPRAIEAI